ncbi:MAG: chromosome segregation protein SMC [Gammaproteobacteria bacterium]|nr:chromosome segregation protein SMC [Gammaproteobacteria bacterium]
MRLKSVKLAGFKSYVDPTVIDLPHNVTVVVGPNGCGKSNIVDAIRLGIGESQASHLRGEGLEDVIFDGSDTRARSGQATIELLFDNEDHKIGGSYANFSELALRREISQDTPSKFYLNGRRCRRRDIRDLFLGSGFGARSYSVIEQGFVGRIVTAKPEDLRLHLEEVAGVSKYRERRRETEKKIETTRENLERVKDHATELARQISYLERQAREAARYSDLREKERSVQAKLVVLQVQTVEAQIQEQEERMEEVSLRVQQELAKLQSIRTELDTLRVREADCVEQFNTVQGESFEARGVLARVEEENRQRKQHRDEAIQARHKAAETQTEQELALTNQQSQISSLRDELSRVENDRKQAATQCGKARKKFTDTQDEVETWRPDWDNFLKEFNEKSNELSLQTDQRARLQQELEAIDHRLAELDEMLATDEHLNDDTPLVEQEKELETELQTTLLRIEEHDEELEALEQLDVQDEEHRRELEGDLSEIRERRSAVTALIEQTLQTDSTVSHEQSMPHHQLQAQPRVGEIIAVQPGYEKAVETVLNSFLPAITVNSIDFETVELDDLSETDMVLVAPSSDSKTGSRLADVITQGQEYVPRLCSDVFVDDDLEAALARQKLLKSHESTVTKSGIWMGKTWIKFNGSTHEKGTVIEHRAEFQELNALHERKAQEHQEKLQTISVRTQQRTQFREALRELRQQQGEANSRLAETRAQIERKKLEHFQASVRSADARKERDLITVRKSNLDQEINSQDDYISKLKVETAKLDKERQLLETKEQENNSLLAAALEEDRAAQAEHHRLDLEYNNLNARIESYTLNSKLLTNNIDELKHRLQTLDQQISDDENAMQKLAVQLADAVKQSAVVDQRLAAVRADRDAILQQIRENNVAESQQQLRVDQKQQELRDFREEHIQLTSKQEYLLTELSALDITLADAKASLDPVDNEESLTRVLNRTQSRIEKLGAVNLAATRDLDTRKAEYETYQSRIEDLELSQDTLEQAMQKIDKETLALFNDVFSRASEMFQKVFARLFGGGRAELILTEDDPLTAGVSMRVQPPGKQIKNRNQLSDGEKALAALAFTFAMFELNPSPICILDEVDAPLDTNNISRFGKLIHSMANDVQFLIITHSRGTMNFAESLIGITMQEAGVSRVVSVDLE